MPSFTPSLFSDVNFAWYTLIRDTSTTVLSSELTMHVPMCIAELCILDAMKWKLNAYKCVQLNAYNHFFEIFFITHCIPICNKKN